MRDIQRHTLGETGLTISEIGLGTVKFGRNTGVKYPTEFAIPDHNSLRRLLDTTRGLGINYLDTAPAYGTSEEALGKLVKADRSHWIISTKVGEYYENEISHFDFSRDKTIRSVESSLLKLGLQALDIVFVHSNGNDSDVIQNSDVLPALIDLKRQGKLRAIGFSGKDAEGSALALEHCDVFMIAFNEEDQSQQSLIRNCHQKNKGVVIKKALASGHSADPSRALRFVNQTTGVTSIIVGTINEEHLRQNVAAITDV